MPPQRDRHKTHPVSVRLPDEERAWLIAYAKSIGRSRRWVLITALREFRERTEANEVPGK